MPSLGADMTAGTLVEWCGWRTGRVAMRLDPFAS